MTNSRLNTPFGVQAAASRIQSWYVRTFTGFPQFAPAAESWQSYAKSPCAWF